MFIYFLALNSKIGKTVFIILVIPVYFMFPRLGFYAYISLFFATYLLSILLTKNVSLDFIKLTTKDLKVFRENNF